MKKKIGFLLCLMLCISFMIHAQHTVKGTIVDKDTQEPLIGATVYDPASKAATVTNLDGTFSLKLPSVSNRQIEISYVGYLTQKMNVSEDMGTIAMKSDAVVIGDVVITSSVAIRRKTPVALSVIEPDQIEFKLSTQEYPEILKSTPSVYATKQGGGFGDSQIRLRGFTSANIAVMINGVPMNDMEWGGVYWSNWAGLSDVTRSMQVQRGLGASKVSAPSVGGSINIVTKSTDAEKGGFVYYGLGNDSYNKLAFSVSTGLNPKGWAVTMLGSKTWGDGYILGTAFESYSYFLNISKIINDSHQLSFTGFGAAQWHDQRNNNDLLLISEWQEQRDSYKYSPTYGFDSNGQVAKTNYNHYNKPQLSLNHYWTLNEKSSLSSVLYLSLGDGGGYSWRGKQYTDMYGSSNTTGEINKLYRTPDGYRDYGDLMQKNAAHPNGSQAVVTDSHNNHFWTGLISTYTTKLASNIDFYGGLDLRYYEGLHYNDIVNLMGGKYFVDPARESVKNKSVAGSPDYVNEKLKEGDKVYRDYTGYVMQEGVFAQAEYTKEKLNVFLAGSISNSTYWKIDRFYYDNEKSDVGNFLGFTAKGGANYNLTGNHNVYANIGYISRAPFMASNNGGFFVNATTSNVINPDAINEKSFSMELGYGYRSKILSGNLNLYRTSWLDKTMVKTLGSNAEDNMANISGLDALHQGIEVDFTFKPINDLDITGMFSLGDWKWTSNGTGYVFNKDGQAVDSKGNPVEPHSPEQATVIVNLDGVKVGGAAQLTFALGTKYKLMKDFTVGADYTHFARNYADYAMTSNIGTINYRTPWMIPEAGTVDINANYKFKIGSLDALIMGNVINLLDQTYITDARDLNAANPNSKADWKSVAVMYGFGRTYSVALKVRF